MKDREEAVVVVVTSEDGQLRGDWHSARHLPPHGPLLPEGGPQPDHEMLLPGKPQHRKYFGIGLLNFFITWSISIRIWILSFKAKLDSEKMKLPGP